MKRERKKRIDYNSELIEAKIDNALDRYEYSEYWNFKSESEEEFAKVLITKASA